MYYINLFAKLQRIIKRDTLIEKDRLLAIQEALVGFLMDEVVNPQGNIIMTAIQLTDSPPRKAK
jgi:hypothetical protein